MSIHRKIEIRIWQDERVRRLSPMKPSGQSLWFYLLTGPHTGIIPGLFSAGHASLAESLGWSPEAFEEAFREVFREGLLKDSPKDRLIWIPNAIKYNPPASPNVVRSWASALDFLPECPLFFEAVEHLRDEVYSLDKKEVKGFAKAFNEVFPKGFAKGNENPSPNQEQEQDTGTVEKKEEDAAVAAPVKLGIPVETAIPAPKPRRSPKLPAERDLLRDFLNAAFLAKIKVYARPERENPSLLRLAAAIRRKAAADDLAPEDAARGCLETFWRLHETGKQFYSDFTPSKMLSALEGLWAEYAKARAANDTSWIEEAAV